MLFPWYTAFRSPGIDVVISLSVWQCRSVGRSSVRPTLFLAIRQVLPFFLYDTHMTPENDALLDYERLYKELKEATGQPSHLSALWWIKEHADNERFDR